MPRKRKTKSQGAGDVDLVVIVADTHTNSTRGLRPPRFYDKELKEYRHAEQTVVDELWKPWLAHAKDVKRERRRLERLGYHVRVILAHLGDGADRNRYDTEGYELLSANRVVITDLCEATLEPLLEPGLIDVWIFERGTPGHDGGSGELTELLAERISRRANVWREDDKDTWSHYTGRFLFQGVDMMFSHHPRSRSYLYHTRNASADRSAHYYWDGFNIPLITKNKVTYEREPSPELMFFGHVHYDADSGESSTRRLRAVYVASWQLPYSYIHRIGAGIKPNPVGAQWVRCHDGEYFLYRPWLHTPRAQGAVRV